MSGWVSSTGWNINLASPGPIGNVTPSTGAFTTLNASNSVTLSGGTANGVIYLNGSKIATSGSALTFDGANFCVGTETGSAKINAAVDDNAAYQLAADFSNKTNADFQIQIKSNSSMVGPSTSTPLCFGVSNSEKGRFGLDGAFYVGTTQPYTYDDGGTIISPGNDASTLVKHATGTPSSAFYSFFIYAGNIIGSISQDGTTGVLFNTSSDQRLKTNVQPADSAIQSILDFPVTQFDWIESGDHQDFGAIAQQVQSVIPEMVFVPANDKEMWGIDWSKAVPRLIKTVQELYAEIENLKNQLNNP